MANLFLDSGNRNMAQERMNDMGMSEGMRGGGYICDFRVLFY